MLKPRQKRRPIVDINVVPYIDVMLVLLMVFMISAPLLTQGVHVNLPKAAAKEMTTKNSEPIIVTVDKDGRYYLSINKKPKQAINANTLSDEVGIALGRAKQKHQNRDVYVRGDNLVDYGKVVQAMVLLQHAGATNVGLITDDTKH